jgi:hypothetical protein
MFNLDGNALNLGAQIFQSLQKASLSKWEGALARDSKEAVACIQSAIVGQTFGLLSGEAKHLAQVDAFHGAIISWARMCKNFSACHKQIDVASLSEP